ncbi:MAG: transcription termination/antitermination NusG family protein [Thermoguttaceae bacterium]|jgi:transcriptional antiterminator RfaH
MIFQQAGIYPADLFETAPRQTLDQVSWAVYTKSRQEKAFSRHLLANRISHCLPLVEKTSVSRGRKYSARVPLFPGYVFMRASEQERVCSLASNRVSKIILVHDPDRLWKDLEQVFRLISSGAPLTVEQRLSPGNRVRIRRGALAGMEGTVRARRGKTRLIVTVTFLQQGASFEVDDFNLEPID